MSFKDKERPESVVLVGDDGQGDFEYRPKTFGSQRVTLVNDQDNWPMPRHEYESLVSRGFLRPERGSK